MKKVRQKIRQLRYAPEFRIAEPPWSEKLARSIEKLATEPAGATTAGAACGEDKTFLRFLADMATGVWRLRRRWIDPATRRPLEQFRREYRHVESLCDVLAQFGVEIKDHEGQPFDAGLALKVLEYLPRAGVTRERVQETIKPSVFYHGRHIQMGEVFVETPEKPVAQASLPVVEEAPPTAPPPRAELPPSALPGMNG